MHIYSLNVYIFIFIYTHIYSGNQTEQEIASITRLKTLSDHIIPTDIGKLFKRYAIENDIRVPVCVQQVNITHN